MIDPDRVDADEDNISPRPTCMIATACRDPEVCSARGACMACERPGKSFTDKLADAGIEIVEDPNVPPDTAIMGDKKQLYYSDMGTPICADEKGCPHPGFCAHALMCPSRTNYGRKKEAKLETPEAPVKSFELKSTGDPLWDQMIKPVPSVPEFVEELARSTDYPRLWDSEPDGVTHIAGGCIVIADRFMRQRCEWCGIVLLEYDLKLTAVQGDVWTPPAQFPTGKLIRVDGHVSAPIENPQEVDGMIQLPTDCCAFDPKTQVGK